ncbi:MAG: hypothetical protein V5B30_03075 [Candidatus Accumulibacter delftensis]
MNVVLIDRSRKIQKRQILCANRSVKRVIEDYLVPGRTAKLGLLGISTQRSVQRTAGKQVLLANQVFALFIYRFIHRKNSLPSAVGRTRERDTCRQRCECLGQSADGNAFDSIVPDWRTRPAVFRVLGHHRETDHCMLLNRQIPAAWCVHQKPSHRHSESEPQDSCTIGERNKQNLGLFRQLIDMETVFAFFCVYFLSECKLFRHQIAHSLAIEIVGRRSTGAYLHLPGPGAEKAAETSVKAAGER